ncbi:MAG: DUF4440 domain-containing protein [Patescibacteria group bacterium]|nr:DUF4440 domain-containing protein [Patescibacteria group bacterium]
MKYIVKKFELDLLDPKIRKSPESLSELLADDFFEFTQSGTACTKKDIIEVLPTLPEENISVRDYQEKLLAPNLILVHYIADRLVPSSGLKRTTLCSSIWKNIRGRWQMVFFQGTPALMSSSG